MLVTFQFPIADARRFVPRLDLCLPLPDWPEPDTSVNPQFVHHFGSACERIGGPDEAWPDEIKYCHARGALRFDRLEKRHAGLPDRMFRPRCAFRRLFCDGQAVVRVEIGISNKHWVNPLENLEIEEVLSIARETTELPTLVPSIDGDSKPRPILAQGKHIARLYAHASMNRAATGQSVGLRLVEAGDPMILVQLRPEEANLDLASRPADGLTAVARESVKGANALFCRLNTRGGIVSAWILQRGRASVGQLRSLRLCLTRLHAEREVLDLILKQIHRKRLLAPPDEESVNLLDLYFNERIRIINRDTWGGVKQSEIVAAFDATQAMVRPASQTQLISRYEGSRRQVWKKIAAYQEQRRATRLVYVLNVEKGWVMVDKQVNVGGTGNIVNVAEYMSNVTNTVNNNLAESDADMHVKMLIKELTEQIDRVAPKADPGQIKKMGKNLEALSKEVASDEPERRWYEVSLEGIRETAQAVGEIATPILNTVGKLSALLLRV
ncbi:MAG: hypothetical protein GXX96_10170 [Planctomycetaceae bacterium]|nr:hypothetical protein [Planctomycetaceae bacterium]